MQVRRLVGTHLNFGRDVKLFLAYMFCANIGFGVFTLIFNLYVYALDFREDSIGLFSSVQTFTMAATALLLGMLISRIGLWLLNVGSVAICELSRVGLGLSAGAAALLLCSGTSGMGLAVIFPARMPFIIDYG